MHGGGAEQHGRDYDFSRPFFQQFAELYYNVPEFARLVSEETLVRSDYCNLSSYLKDCYLIFNSDYDENCFYGGFLERSKDCVDVSMSDSCELCCEVVNCYKCYNCTHIIDCQDCHEVSFSQNLRGCSYCFGCINLRGKQYYIFNIPYSKEEYFRELRKYQIATYAGRANMLQLFDKFKFKFPFKNMIGLLNKNITGDYIFESKNVKSGYQVLGAQDCAYCHFMTIAGTSDAYDFTMWGGGAQLMYECIGAGGGQHNIRFCFNSWSRSINLQYCWYISNTQNSNLFGCIGLRNKQYCILNKQYTKEEYEALVPKIIEHMNTMPYTDAKGRVYKYGEFFPPELSPFAYNETIAQEYFPLTKESALEQGYRWKEPEEKEHTPTMSWRDLPDNIKDVSDSILNEAILCAAWDEDAKKAQEHNCTKVFRIIPQELAFYRKMSARGGSASGGNLPLPRFCPNSRHFHRIQQRNPLRLWHRKCMCQGAQTYAESDTDVSAQTHADDTQNNAEIGLRESASGQRESALPYINTANHFHGVAQCPNEFETSYAPERPEIVYCEKCYQAEAV